MADFFGGIFDSVRGSFDDVGGFFSSAMDSTLPSGASLVSSSKEADLISSGWESSSDTSIFGGSSSLGGGGLGILGKAVQAFGGTNKGQPVQQIGIESGTLPTGAYRTEVPTGATKGTPSVDFGSLEAEWINRLHTFAQIDSYSKRFEVKGS